MKTTKYIMIALLGGLTVLSSCTSMDEDYKGFLEGGEIVYRAKAKEVVASPGLNRVKLEWQLEYPTQVVKCEVRNGDKVLATLPVKYEDLVKLTCTIDKLEEQTYTLSIYSFDAQGNSSIKEDVIVDVYGQRYINTLRTERSIGEVLRKADAPSNVMITLSANASTKLVGTDIIYQSVAGETKTAHALPTQNVIELMDVAADSYFKLQDSWKPTAIAIDEFKAPIRSYEAKELPIGSARTFTNVYKLENTVFVSLSTAASNVLRSVIRYGSNKEVTVELGTNKVTLEDVSDNDVLEMVTFVKKGEDNTEYTTLKQTFATSTLLNLKKVAMNDWAVTGFSSSQASEGNVTYTFDNDFSTFWHTEYSPNSHAYPHYISIDMKTSHPVKGIAVARRINNSSIATNMKLEVSTDGTTWTSVGEFAPNNSIDGLQVFQLSNPTEGRYFKLTGLVGSTAHMCISEINIYE